MSVRRESRAERYDAIVIGSGMGGLSAAALLAKAGKQVLVVERHDRPGGYAHSFKRGKYHFDSAAHITSSAGSAEFGNPGLIDQTLRALGVRDRCTFLPVQPYYTAIFPDQRFTIPMGIAEFIHAHAEHFPGEERGLRELLRLHLRISNQDRQMPPDIGAHDRSHLAAELPLIAEYTDVTLGQVLDRYLTEPRLKALFAVLWGYLGLPPSQLAFIPWVGMMTSMVHTGAFACQGGLQTVADAFVTALERDGGELLLRSQVRRIMVQDGRVTGVTLENGQRIRAPIVISNADAMQTFEEMIGFDRLPGPFVQRLLALVPSLSAVVAYLATDLDLAQLGVTPEITYFRSWDHDETYREILAGRPAGAYLNIPTILDPSLAPPGEHLLTITTLIPYTLVESWREEKEHFAALLQREVETIFPDIRGHITFMEGASPRTLERYTLNLAGAMYGWEQTPQQTGLNWLPRRTPIAGLLLSGHWTQPGGGVVTTVVSGVQTAQLLLGYPDMTSLLRSFA